MPLYAVLHLIGPFLSEASAYTWIVRNTQPQDESLQQYQVLEMALPQRDRPEPGPTKEP